jgi:hypothetical protein
MYCFYFQLKYNDFFEIQGLEESGMSKHTVSGLVRMLVLSAILFIQLWGSAAHAEDAVCRYCAMKRSVGQTRPGMQIYGMAPNVYIKDTEVYLIKYSSGRLPNEPFYNYSFTCFLSFVFDF